ncbi:hypothetical protein CONPUDRAFT_150742 [Coniophora puteana RWD-64-598 SS2]|uniref:Uncharacterized protein n=1 Tax=Coniophora puteana (strain RWD-64-598) TaxID=741705 RepID=A0A5M3MY21_CONPW|nr:uncharacterized protein CONPUDRAFT_150742 [Coniophora puteana RWD-64-598 SS2]EIW83674.1 hypothetical protein CONPUDRAFT_150742 [Coniophora puteana RWD-64-598 SS2]
MPPRQSPPVEDFSDQIRNIATTTEDKDAEEREHLSIMQVNAATARESELRTGFTRLQTKYVALRTKCKAMDRELYLLRMAAADGSITMTEASLGELSKGGGRKYFVLVRLWVPDRVFPLPENIEFIDPNDPSRWQTKDMELLGHITDLFGVLDERLREAALEFPLFAQQFCAGVEAERRTCVSTIKDNIAAILSDFITLDPITAGNSSLLMAHPGIVALRRNPTEPDVEYPKYSSVLYADPNNPETEGLFRSSALIKAAKCILFGKTSIGVRGGSGGRTPKGELWNMTEPTPGLIAGVSVLVIHRIGEDDSFTPKRNRSGVDWTAVFDFLYMLLTSSDTEDFTEDLFEFWSVMCFGQTPSSRTLTATETVTSSAPAKAAAPAVPVDPVFEAMKRRRAEPTEDPNAPLESSEAPAEQAISNMPRPPFGTSRPASPVLPSTIMPSVSSGMRPSITGPNSGAAPLAQATFDSVSAAALQRGLDRLSIGDKQGSISLSALTSLPSSAFSSPSTAITVPVTTPPIQKPHSLRRGETVLIERAPVTGSAPSVISVTAEAPPSFVSVAAPPPAAPMEARTTRSRGSKSQAPGAGSAAQAAAGRSDEAGKGRLGTTRRGAVARGS